jgi:hypothetical protein
LALYGVIYCIFNFEIGKTLLSLLKYRCERERSKEKAGHKTLKDLLPFRSSTGSPATSFLFNLSKVKKQKKLTAYPAGFSGCHPASAGWL